LTVAQIQAAMNAAVSDLYNINISATPARKVRDYPVAILFDADANQAVQADADKICEKRRSA